jgi:hypothetical protein
MGRVGPEGARVKMAGWDAIRFIVTNAASVATRSVSAENLAVAGTSIREGSVTTIARIPDLLDHC